MKLFARLLAGALGAVLAIGLMSPAASATQVDSDDVFIAGPRADFGVENHWAGLPVGPGLIIWDQTGSMKTATLTGFVHYDDALNGGCARVKFTLYNSSGDVLSTRKSVAACRTGPGVVEKEKVKVSLQATNASKVTVTTQSKLTGHAYRNELTKAFSLS